MRLRAVRCLFFRRGPRADHRSTSTAHFPSSLYGDPHLFELESRFLALRQYQTTNGHAPRARIQEEFLQSVSTSASTGCPTVPRIWLHLCECRSLETMNFSNIISGNEVSGGEQYNLIVQSFQCLDLEFIIGLLREKGFETLSSEPAGTLPFRPGPLDEFKVHGN